MEGDMFRELQDAGESGVDDLSVGEDCKEFSFNRRQLLLKAGALGLAAAGLEMLSGMELFGLVSRAEAAVSGSVVAVSTGKNIFRMVSSVVGQLGGMSKFVKKGARVVIKPNIAWSRTPEQAANTNPEVVDAVIRLCQSAGAGSITVCEHPCNNHALTFKSSGIEKVCKDRGVSLVATVRPDQFGKVAIPRGKVLKSVNAVKLITEADCYINIPIAKVHASGVVTLALKNQMGCVQDRGLFHRSGLHQCIADCATVLKPDLNILDAVRVMLTHGPAGPGQVKVLNKIAASVDIVAIDAYGAGFLGYKPGDVEHIVRAGELGLGQRDLSKIRVVEV